MSSEGLSTGEIPNYTAIQGMVYLDQCVHESLRKWPQAPSIGRSDQLYKK